MKWYSKYCIYRAVLTFDRVVMNKSISCLSRIGSLYVRVYSLTKPIRITTFIKAKVSDIQLFCFAAICTRQKVYFLNKFCGLFISSVTLNCPFDSHIVRPMRTQAYLGEESPTNDLTTKWKKSKNKLTWTPSHNGAEISATKGPDTLKL